ncbi:uncharacterized protein [Lolium perenne]|uniref:uncharacterized protein isoform X3 n=1 Tax=Lolium perenne TaxID=4522 RepID=UPI003A99850A
MSRPLPRRSGSLVLIWPSRDIGRGLGWRRRGFHGSRTASREKRPPRVRRRPSASVAKSDTGREDLVLYQSGTKSAAKSPPFQGSGNTTSTGSHRLPADGQGPSTLPLLHLTISPSLIWFSHRAEVSWFRHSRVPSQYVFSRSQNLLMYIAGVMAVCHAVCITATAVRTPGVHKDRSSVSQVFISVVVPADKT